MDQSHTLFWASTIKQLYLLKFYQLMWLLLLNCQYYMKKHKMQGLAEAEWLWLVFLAVERDMEAQEWKSVVLISALTSAPKQLNYTDQLDDYKWSAVFINTLKWFSIPIMTESSCEPPLTELLYCGYCLWVLMMPWNYFPVLYSSFWVFFSIHM